MSDSPLKHISDIIALTPDEIWVATIGKGIQRVNMFDTTIVNAPFQESANYSMNIVCFEKDENDNIWIGTRSGLQYWSRAAREKGEAPLPFLPGGQYCGYVNSLMIDQKGILWIGTRQNGLLRYNIETESSTFFRSATDSHSLPSDNVRDVLQSSDGRIWVGTMEGLAIFQPESNNFRVFRKGPVNERALSDNTIYSLFEDKSEILWVGTYLGGINKLDRINERFFEINNFVRDAGNDEISDVRSVTVEDDGTAWIGTSNGLVKINPGIISVENPYDEIEIFYKGESISSMIFYKPFGLITRIRNELYVYKNGSIQTYLSDRIIRDTGISNLLPVSSFVDSDMNLWIGLSDGLIKYDRNSDRFIAFNPRGPDNEKYDAYVLAIEEDYTGLLWVGTFNGELYMVNRFTGQFELFVPESGSGSMIKFTKIFSIEEGEKGVVWLGTNRGLYRIDSETKLVERYLSTDGLSNDVVYSVISDRSGNIWCSTNNGISSLNPETGIFRNFIHEESLQSREFNQSAYASSNDGLFFMGGINGLNIFNPDNMVVNSFKPQPVITGMKINYSPASPESFPDILDRQVTEMTEIRMPYKYSNFGFEFAALSYSLPEQSRYEYMLEGYDHNWIDAGGRRYAEFTNIEAGIYTFKVRAANNDGVWSEKPVEIKIIITPPFWQKSWFIIILVILIISTVYLIFRLRLRSIRKRTDQLARMVQAKTSDLSQKSLQIEKQNSELVEINKKLSDINTKIQEKNSLLNEQKVEIQTQRDNLLTMARDVEELNNARISFFTSISHEFRTPLTLIQGPLNEIWEKAPEMNPVEIRKKLEIARANTSKLLVLISQLLDFRRAETDNLRFDAAEFELVSFLRNVGEMFLDLASSRNIGFKMLTPESRVIIWADHDKLEKILFNLLSNAFKYTPEGGEVSIELLVDKDNDGYVSIVIRDTGYGIKAESLPYIFDRFYKAAKIQGDNARYGSGIGLALVKKYVDMHEGSIDVKSQPGRGSVFTVRIPLQNENIEDRGNEIQNIAVDKDLKTSIGVYNFNDSNIILSPVDISKKAILLVEDDTDLKNYLIDILSDYYRIIACESAEDAYNRLLKKMPDLIISDVNLPGKSGYDFTRDIKAKLKTSHIPVILLTSRADDESKHEGLRSGADTIIIKPFDFKQLVLTIENLYLNRKRVIDKYKGSGLELEFGESLSRDDRKFLEKAVKCVEKNLSNSDFDVETFCSEMNYSQPQTYRRIKAITNLSISEFIRSIRLKKASGMLKSGATNIKEVAYSVGFNDPNYFTKSFIRLFGQKPSDQIRKS